MSKETLKFRGVLVGHSDWVTAIATPVDTASDIVISASRCVAHTSLPNAPCSAACSMEQTKSHNIRSSSEPSWAYGERARAA